MKNKLHIGILASHLVVVISLFTPIFRVDETRMGISGNHLTDVHYLNIMQYISNDVHTLTAILMVILSILHLIGIVNGIYGLLFKGYHHGAIKNAFVFGFASATMGALQLYSQSYVFFVICAISFCVISICSIRLMKLEDKNEK
ncbi:MAG: hypothetical protein J6B34_03045 [Clostridia bacterium]|nr:hypothetical protein [Clostridia bacterium]